MRHNLFWLRLKMTCMYKLYMPKMIVAHTLALIAL